MNINWVTHTRTTKRKVKKKVRTENNIARRRGKKWFRHEKCTTQRHIAFAWMWIRIRSRHLKNSRKSRFDMQKWIIMSSLVWVRYIEFYTVCRAQRHIHTHAQDRAWRPIWRWEIFLIFLSRTTAYSLSLSLAWCLYITQMYLCKPVRKYIMVLWRKEFEANDNDGEDEQMKKKIIMLIQPARFRASSVCLGVERIDAIVNCMSSYHGRRCSRRRRRNNMRIQWIDRTMSSSKKKNEISKNANSKPYLQVYALHV